ncbi:unnamed protein product, partial [Acidithrix sp. C25]
VARLITFIESQSNALVDEIHRCWDKGDAVCVLDPRAPAPFLDELISKIDPDQVVRADGSIQRRERIHDLIENCALVATTSGTSGHPKAVQHSHLAMEASAHATLKRIGAQIGDGLWLNALPISHIGGFSTITKAQYSQMPLQTFERFEYDRFTEIAKANKVYMSIVRANLSQINPGDFEYLILGAGVPPENVPRNASVTYGLTETGSGCVYDGVPLDGVEVKIKEDGGILIAGPMLASCYRDSSPLTDSDGFFHSGDVGAMIDGKLTVWGRAAEMIVTGGEKVVPSLLEERIRTLDAVLDVAVVGIDDEDFGQITVAALITNGPISLSQVKDHVREVLPRYYAPRKIVILESLPKTALGKIKKNQVREIVSEILANTD